MGVLVRFLLALAKHQLFQKNLGDTPFLSNNEQGGKYKPLWLDGLVFIRIINCVFVFVGFVLVVL